MTEPSQEQHNYLQNQDKANLEPAHKSDLRIDQFVGYLNYLLGLFSGLLRFFHSQHQVEQDPTERRWKGIPHTAAKFIK